VCVGHCDVLNGSLQVCICANQLGQRAALRALQPDGAQYRDSKIKTLQSGWKCWLNFKLLLCALKAFFPFIVLDLMVRENLSALALL